MFRNSVRIGNLTIFYTIGCAGQEDPCVGDGVVAQGVLHLPAKDKALHPDISFGKRLLVFGEELHPHWGSYSMQDNSMYMSVSCSGVTWSESFSKVRHEIDSAISSLAKMVNDRAHAYLSAHDMRIDIGNRGAKYGIVMGKNCVEFKLYLPTDPNTGLVDDSLLSSDSLLGHYLIPSWGELVDNWRVGTIKIERSNWIDIELCVFEELNNILEVIA